MTFAPLLLALVVGTWNGRWFPSGRAEHRASEEVESATIRAAGQMLRNGLGKMDPSGCEDVVLCLNEIRDLKTAEALCREIGRTNLSVAIVSGYRRRDRFDQQQDVIMTTLPVAIASWSRWKVWKEDSPPRGYARADLIVSPSVTATVYAVHLKSNYGQTSDAAATSNRLKRGRAIGQLVEQEQPKRGKYRAPVIIAGDFNADRFSPEFKDEHIFRTLAAANFMDAFEAADESSRITYQSNNRKYGSTLDYIMSRGFEQDSPPFVLPSLRLSDHNAVFVRFSAAECSKM